MKDRCSTKVIVLRGVVCLGYLSFLEPTCGGGCRLCSNLGILTLTAAAQSSDLH